LMERWRKSGNPKFLGQTVRVSMALAKLGVVPGMIEGLVADAEDGLLPAPEVQEPSAALLAAPASNQSLAIASDPPAGDCSHAAMDRTPTTAAPATAKV